MDRFADQAEKLRVTDAVVLKSGSRIGEYHREEEIRRNQYSASKSFTSTAVGIAVKEGLFALDDPICGFFKEELPENPPEYLKMATVRDLLTMCLGQEKACLMGAERWRLNERDWVKYALSRPFVNTPGEKFLYNNAGPYLAGILVQKKAGCSLVDYLTPRLFEPLGIPRPTWETDPLGRTFGAGGLFLSVSELARFAGLYLQDGEWEGKRILSKEWVREATAKQTDTYGHGDGGMGYGYLFWRGRHDSFRADGKYGQFAIVLREKNAVIAVNAESYEAWKILDLIWETLYPML